MDSICETGRLWVVDWFSEWSADGWNKFVFSYLYVGLLWERGAATRIRMSLLQQSINICLPGPQQQTCSSGFATVGPCSDRHTDIVPFHRPASHTAGSANNPKSASCGETKSEVDKIRVTKIENKRRKLIRWRQSRLLYSRVSLHYKIDRRETPDWSRSLRRPVVSPDLCPTDLGLNEFLSFWDWRKIWSVQDIRQ